MKDDLCRRCNGQGETFVLGYQSRYVTCPHCKGKGFGPCRINCMLCAQGEKALGTSDNDCNHTARNDDYLKPADRSAVRYQTGYMPGIGSPVVRHILDSHVVMDGLLDEARETLGDLHHWATNYHHSDPEVLDMLSAAGDLMRRIDAVLAQGEDE